MLICWYLDRARDPLGQDIIVCGTLYGERVRNERTKDWFGADDPWHLRRAYMSIYFHFLGPETWRNFWNVLDLLNLVCLYITIYMTTQSMTQRRYYRRTSRQYATPKPTHPVRSPGCANVSLQHHTYSHICATVLSLLARPMTSTGG